MPRYEHEVLIGLGSVKDLSIEDVDAFRDSLTSELDRMSDFGWEFFRSFDDNRVMIFRRSLDTTQAQTPRPDSPFEEWVN